MKQNQVSIVVLSLIAVAGIVPGCARGGRTGSRISEAGQAEIADKAQQLEFRVMAADAEDPEYPDRSNSIQGTLSAEEVIAMGDELELKNTIAVSDAPSFLVINERFLGQKIEDATFEHRIQNPKNEKLGEPDRFTVSWDSVARRWFIPFKKVFQGRFAEIHSSDVHLITMDFYFSGGKRQIIRLRMRARYNTPEIKPNILSRNLMVDDYVGQANAMTQGLWIIARDQYTNPVHRPLTLWLKAHGSTPAFTYKLFLGASETYGIPQNVVQVPYEPKAVRIIHPDSRAEVADLKYGEWAQVQIQAKETLTLEWIARARDGVQTCSPIIVPRRLKDLPFGIAIPLPLTPEATRFWGSWKQTVLVGELQDINTRMVLDQEHKISDGAGWDWLPGQVPAPCQGLYK